MNNQFTKEYNRYFTRHFLRLSVVIFLLLTLFFLLGTGLFVQRRKTGLKAEQQRKVLSEQYFLEYSLKESVYDLRVMTDNLLFRDILTRKNKNEELNIYLNGLVTDIFSQKVNYYQFRFLNNRGMEIFRMERINGNPVITPLEKLQDKSKRYYFRETIKLDRGFIYVSPFDLNVEQEKIEKPFRPMIRICISVFSESGEKIGINVLNYDGTNLLEELQEKTSHEAGASYLVNKDGER